MEQEWTTTTARDGMMRWTAPTSVSAEDMSNCLSFTPPPTPPPKDVFDDAAAPFRVAPTVVAPAPRRHNYSDSEPCVRPATRRVRRYASLSDLEDDAQFVAPTVPHALPPKLELALAEIVETEFAYVAHLERLVNVYLAYLPSVLSTDAIVALVRNAGALLTLHARLADAIGANASTRTKVCQVLESYAADMGELYAEFCAGHHAAAAILRRAQERDPQLWAAWERDRASRNSNAPGHRRHHSVDTPPSAPTSLALSFSDLLIMPVQRVCKYHLLVSGLLYSSGNDPEESFIRSAVSAMQGVAACVDEAQRLRESEDRARVVLERMENHPEIAPGFIASLGPCILIGALDVLYYPISATKPPLVSMSSQTSSVTSSSTYPVYTSTAYATPSPGPHSQLGSPSYPSTPHPLPPNSSVPFPQPTPAATPITPHPLLALPKPPKAKHLAAFLWSGYLILCKVHPRRARYEPRHWFPLKFVPPTSAVKEEVANVSDSGVSDCDPFEPSPDASPLFGEASLGPESYPYSSSYSRSRSNIGHPSKSQSHLQTQSQSHFQTQSQSVRTSPVVQQEGQAMGPGHVHVSANSAVFPFGVRISFGRHVFELGAACAEEQAVWLAAVENARVAVGGEKDKENAGKELVLAAKARRELVKGKELATAGRPGKELVLASQQRKEAENASAKVSRSKSATATVNTSEYEREREAGGANLVRGRSEGSYVSEREPSSNGALGLGIAERVESVFLKDRAGRAADHLEGYNPGSSPGGYNASLMNGSSSGSSVTRNTSGNAGRTAMRLSVISGPGGTFRGTLSSGAGGEGRGEGRMVTSAEGRMVSSADARALVLADRTTGSSEGRTLGHSDSRMIGPADGRTTDLRTLGPADARGLTVSTGANVARTNSSSTNGSRSFPPSPVISTRTLAHVSQSSSQVQGLQPPQTQTLQIQPHVQSLQPSQSQPQTPHPHPTHSQPHTPHPNSQPQPQAALVVRRPSASARDIVDRALIDVFSRTCSEARMKGLRRGPLFPSPEDETPTKSNSGTGITIGMGMGAIGMGMGMGKGRPRRTSSALVGRNRSLLDALPGDRNGKDKEKEKKKADVRSSSPEGIEPGSESHETEGAVVGQSKTPLQRKRATIHGAMQTFPSMDPPSPAGEPERRHMRGQSASAHGHSYAVQVVAPGGQVIHNGQAPKPQAPNAQQPAGQVSRNGSTASQRGPISPPRSRTVSSSGSFADGMRELFTRRTFTKSAENVAVTSAHANAPTPVYSVGAGLSNTRSEEGLAPHVRPKAKASSAPALADPEEGLYSLGAGITNTNTPPRKHKVSTTGRSPGSGGKTGGGLLGSLAALTKRRTRSGAAPLSALTFTPLNEKEPQTSEERYSQTARSRSNEWYHPVPAIRGPPNRGMLGAELYTHPALRLQPSPVAEEGMFADFGDEVYDEERY